MAKRGPKGPTITINWVEFEKLCALHCTQIEIAEWFDCSEDTVDRHVKAKYGENFAEVFKRKSGRGKISLRRKMFEAANNGNITMMIWLSKQHLGMSDKLEEKLQHAGSIKNYGRREALKKVFKTPKSRALVLELAEEMCEKEEQGAKHGKDLHKSTS